MLEQHQEGQKRGLAFPWGALREIAETVVIAVVIYWTVTLVVYNFRVLGSSMEPSLHDGQYLLVNKAIYFSLDTGELKRWFPIFDWGEPRVNYLFSPPRRGDIVIFQPPNGSSAPYIKRVIALPGETVEIRGGAIYVDGWPLEEPYAKERPAYTVGAQVVPPNYYFVLGDNRNNSSDSHIWGMVPYQNIVGKTWLAYWPPDQWGFIPEYRF